MLPGRGDHTIRIFPGDQQMTDVEEEVQVGMSDVPDKLQRACGRWQGSGWGVFDAQAQIAPPLEDVHPTAVEATSWGLIKTAGAHQ